MHEHDFYLASFYHNWALCFLDCHILRTQLTIWFFDWAFFVFLHPKCIGRESATPSHRHPALHSFFCGAHQYISLFVYRFWPETKTGSVTFWQSQQHVYESKLQLALPELLEHSTSACCVVYLFYFFCLFDFHRIEEKKSAILVY